MREGGCFVKANKKLSITSGGPGRLQRPSNFFLRNTERRVSCIPSEGGRLPGKYIQGTWRFPNSSSSEKCCVVVVFTLPKNDLMVTLVVFGPITNFPYISEHFFRGHRRVHRRTRECERTWGLPPLPSPNSLELRCASSILEANLNFADGISDPPSSLPPRLPNSFFFLGSFFTFGEAK